MGLIEDTINRCIVSIRKLILSDELLDSVYVPKPITKEETELILIDLILESDMDSLESDMDSPNEKVGEFLTKEVFNKKLKTIVKSQGRRLSIFSDDF